MSNYDKNQIVELSDEAMEAVAGGGNLILARGKARAKNIAIAQQDSKAVSGSFAAANGNARANSKAVSVNSVKGSIS